jgi:hypothetical protein
MFMSERARQYLSEVIIATDDERIFGAARDYGSKVRMTRSDHLSGSDRAAEVASSDQASIIVNIQGDEPSIDPAAIDAAVLGLTQEEDAPMSTLAKRIEDPREIDDPNTVKVVMDLRGYALLLLPLSDSVRARRKAALLQAHRLVRIRREFLLGLLADAGRPPRAGREARATAGPWKTATHRGWSKRIRISWRGYPGGPGAAAAVLGRQASESNNNREWQVYFRNGRCSQFIGQRHFGGFHRLCSKAAAGA